MIALPNNSGVNKLLSLFTNNKAKIINYSTQIIMKGLALVLGLIPQRFINNENIPTTDRVGIELVLTINAILFSFIDIGITNILYKSYTIETDKTKIAKIWTFAFIARIVMYFVGLLILFILYSFDWFKLGNINQLIIFGIYTSQYLLIFDSNYKSIADTKNTTFKFTLSDLITKILIATFLIILPLISKDYLNIRTYIIVNIFMYILTNVVDYNFQKEFISWSFPNLEIFKTNYKTILTLMFTGLISTLYAKVPIYFVEQGKDIISFGIASKTFDLLLIIPSLIIPIVSSDFVKKIKDADSATNKELLLKKHLLFSFVIGVFCFVLCILLSYPILYLTNSLRFENAVQYTLLFSINFLFQPVLYFIGSTNFLFSLNKFLILNITILFIIAIPIYYLAYNYFGVVGLISSLTIINIIDLILKLSYLKHKKNSLYA